ncbi:hypothetical protein P154DRAFT_437137 [Amniculicola lignicola CBS 123094]|uniref:Uncharacterized protein n=1 Tax=Amniculicola lignicola CBS 123094 TaxID=1392246 RepID=A0A6A5WP93_9PLEO|nr:hypothetical protein P154DRAFT_437137 [Amniculicola lignicola CBS 123094]
MAAVGFLALPREIRDRIYDEYFSIATPDNPDAYRIERRQLQYFVPSPVAILLLLGYQPLLLDQQIAAEALRILFENHTPLFSVGPSVFRALLERIEEESAKFGEQWLRWLKRFQWDWVTFPSLRHYRRELEALLQKGAYYDDIEMETDELPEDDNGHNDEYDHEGAYYNDNTYGEGSLALFLTWQSLNVRTVDPTSDPYGFSSHLSSEGYQEGDSEETQWHAYGEHDGLIEKPYKRLELLIANEVTPLFQYLATPTFALDSITLPLYFMSRLQTIRQPFVPRPSNLQFWVRVAAHAFLLLSPRDPATAPRLNSVIIKYMPYNIQATLEPADDLERIVREGVWFHEDINAGDRSRQLEGDSFRGLWDDLWERGMEVGSDKLNVEIKLVEWDMKAERRRVGPELELVFRRRQRHGNERHGV